MQTRQPRQSQQSQQQPASSVPNVPNTPNTPIVVPEKARTDFDRANRFVGRPVSAMRLDHSIARGTLIGIAWNQEVADIVATIDTGQGAIEQVLSGELAYILGPNAPRATTSGGSDGTRGTSRRDRQATIVRLGPNARMEDVLAAMGAPIAAHPRTFHSPITAYVDAFRTPDKADLGDGDVFTPGVEVEVVEELHISPEQVGWTVDDLVGEEERAHVTETLRDLDEASQDKTREEHYLAQGYSAEHAAYAAQYERDEAAPDDAPDATEDSIRQCSGCGDDLDRFLSKTGATLCDGCVAEASVGIPLPTPTPTPTPTTSKKATGKAPAKSRASKSVDDQMAKAAAASASNATRSYSKAAQVSRGTGKGKKSASASATK